MDRDQFIAELDLTLAALRRLVLKAAFGEAKLLSASHAATGEVVHHPAPQRQTQTSRVAIPPPAPVEHNGVAIDYAANTVTFCRETAVIGRRQAQMIAVLARAMPNVVLRSEIIARAWPDLTSTSCDNLISTIREPLSAKLAEVGLKLNYVPRFGFALCVADDGEGEQ